MRQIGFFGRELEKECDECLPATFIEFRLMLEIVDLLLACQYMPFGRVRSLVAVPLRAVLIAQQFLMLKIWTSFVERCTLSICEQRMQMRTARCASTMTWTLPLGDGRTMVCMRAMRRR